MKSNWKLTFPMKLTYDGLDGLFVFPFVFFISGNLTNHYLNDTRENTLLKWYLLSEEVLPIIGMFVPTWVRKKKCCHLKFNATFHQRLKD